MSASKHIVPQLHGVAGQADVLVARQNHVNLLGTHHMTVASGRLGTHSSEQGLHRSELVPFKCQI